MKRYIKLYDGVKVNYDGEEFEVKVISELWDIFHWDIKNDPHAKEASLNVTRNLIAMGYCDLTPAMPEGHTLTVEIIPVKEA